MPQTIALTPIDELVQVREALAASAFYPGDLVQLNSATIPTLRRPQASAPLTGPLFAMANTATGKPISSVYTAGETARYLHARPGDEVYGWLAAGYSCKAGSTFLIGGSTLDGALKPASAQTGRELLARAIESKTTTSAKTRLKIRVL